VESKKLPIEEITRSFKVKAKKQKVVTKRTTKINPPVMTEDEEFMLRVIHIMQAEGIKAASIEEIEARCQSLCDKFGGVEKALETLRNDEKVKH